MRAYPSGTESWRISPSGGIEPRWRADGSELFYVGPDHRLMAVAIGRGSGFTAGVPTVVADVRVGESASWDYAVTPDGQQFIVKQPTNEGHSSPINVVLEWGSLLQSFQAGNVIVVPSRGVPPARARSRRRRQPRYSSDNPSRRTVRLVYVRFS